MVGKIAVFLYTHDFPGSLELLDWTHTVPATERRNQAHKYILWTKVDGYWREKVRFSAFADMLTTCHHITPVTSLGTSTHINGPMCVTISMGSKRLPHLKRNRLWEGTMMD